MHNAMTYSDVKTYALQLLSEVNLKLNGSQVKTNRSEIDEEVLAN
jgi:hypothetical protein